MQVFGHHLYEYKKGLRNLVLHTIGAEHLDTVVRRLDTAEIVHELYPVGDSGRWNVFFGDPASVEVIRRIGKDNLTDYTPEEDFILGVMLGYERRQQCERYLEQRDLWEKRNAPEVANQLG